MAGMSSVPAYDKNGARLPEHYYRRRCRTAAEVPELLRERLVALAEREAIIQAPLAGAKAAAKKAIAAAAASQGGSAVVFPPPVAAVPAAPSTLPCMRDCFSPAPQLGGGTGGSELKKQKLSHEEPPAAALAVAQPVAPSPAAAKPEQFAPAADNEWE